MAYGSVNVPGVNHQELDAVKAATQAAQRTADEAKVAAQKAQGTADDAKGTAVTMKPATGSAAGTPGLVPAPAAGAQNKYLRGDGTWQTPPDTNTTYSNATQSANGLMSAADKKKLDGITAGANNYSHPTNSGNKHIPSGGSSGQILRWSADGTATWGADNNTTYSVATQSANGLMSAADKKKLDGIATGASAPFIAQSSAPSNTKTLWIDTTAGTGGLKYYNGSAWVSVPVAYK